jgi:hypothetical protein
VIAARLANGQSCHQRATHGSANGQKVALDYPVCHQTIRCATRVSDCNGRLRQKRKGITHCSLSGGVPDCPVHPQTEGNQSLPNGTQTAPSCLGAIKGTPRCMEQNTNHSLNIQQRRDIEFTPLLSLIEIWALVLSCNSVVLCLCSSLLFCVHESL